MSGKRKITIRFIAKEDNDPTEFIGKVADRLPNDELNFEVMESVKHKSLPEPYVQETYIQPLQNALVKEPITPLKPNKNERAEAEWKKKVDYVQEIQAQGGKITGRVTE